MTRATTSRTSPPPRSRARAAKPARERAPRQSALRSRRREQKKATWILFSILFGILCAIALYILWLPALRVSAIEAEGIDTQGIARAAESALEGRVFGVLPRNSIFLIPENDIRARVLEAYPSVQAVSISATGLTTLKVKALARSSAFVWCGESVELPSPSCYEADAEGLIFAPYERVSMGTSTASTTDADLLVYGALEGAGESPVRAHVTYASALPGALKFIKAMRGLGADIRSVTLRGDEIDLHTAGNTRITYVIGKEGEAAILAATAFPNLDLNDGSIQYVDLRFQNKVYLKRRGEE